MKVEFAVTIMFWMSGVLAVHAQDAVARNFMNDADQYREFLQLKHLQGDEQAANVSLGKLMDRLPDGDKLKTMIAESDLSNAAVEPEPTELAFATGKKSEFYCKGKGLVMAEGQHNDGGWSKLLLISADRGMDEGDYSVVKGGSQWIYELSSNYRQPIRSEVWQTWGRDGGFTIFEVRRLPGNKVDQGNWDYEWSPGSFSRRQSVNGENIEPVRNMFMAMQYHLWGNEQLGYDFNFTVGSTDEKMWRAHGETSGRFPIQTKRSVTQHLPEFSYADASGANHTYADCFRVDLEMTYDPTRSKAK